MVNGLFSTYHYHESTKKHPCYLGGYLSYHYRFIVVLWGIPKHIAFAPAYVGTHGGIGPFDGVGLGAVLDAPIGAGAGALEG